MYTKEQLKEELKAMDPNEVMRNDVMELEEYKKMTVNWEFNPEEGLYGYRLKVISVDEFTREQTNQIYYYYKIQDYLVVLDKNKDELKLCGKYDDYTRIGYSNMGASILLGYFPTQYYFIPNDILIKRIEEKQQKEII